VEPEQGEEVYFHGHPSWRSILGFYIKGIVVSALAGAVAGIITAIVSSKVVVGWVIAAVAVGFVIVLVVGLVRRIATTYTISNQRLTIQKGILSREMHETRLERVQNVNATQSFLERILKVGTVDFDTAASAEYDFKFVGVSDPQQIVRTVDQALRAFSSGPGPTVGPGAGPQASAGV
jgi:uncharacterized membrane protein YdbT with pleckstrin-like domain